MSKFEELRDKRLPVALRKIELLGNLGRPSYGATDYERTKIVAALENAVDALRVAYKLNPRAVVSRDGRRAKDGVPPPPRPKGTAEGGASFEAEVRWAIDAIRRGDNKLAEERLKRCLTA